MLDLVYLRTHRLQAIAALEKRGQDPSLIEDILQKDALRRACVEKTQNLRQRHKKLSQAIYQTTRMISLAD